MRGRRPAGPGYVEHLQGSAETKRRLKVILQTMRGELRLTEACDLLKVCPQRFHQLREEAMQGALAALEPRPIGRPRHIPSPADKQVEQLEQKLADAEVELRAAQAREEIALVLPRAAQEPTPEKKNAPEIVKPTPDPWLEEEHVQRIQNLCRERPQLPASGFSRRGFRQQQRRRQEHELRGRIVTLGDSLNQQGYTLVQQADLLQLSARTLRQWRYDFQAPPPAPPLLGRRVRRACVASRNAVIDLLNNLGPAIGVPTLRASFPDMLRAELEDLLRRYRRVCRRRYHEAMLILSWQVPGRVWAIDFTEAPSASDGLFPYLLAVRDLASGRQLLWQPVTAADGYETRLALASLFVLHGAPLVLKSDNGSPFDADATLALLYTSGVIPLFSPPYYPEYNGAIEAGICSLTTRTDYHAARHDRPGQWTYDDVAAAQAEANATARPHGPTGPTPDQSWAARPTITADERVCFQDTVNRHRHEVRLEQGKPVYGPLGHQEERAMDRLAIQRALVEHGYLLFSRRRIPLPFRRKKVTEIT